MEANNEEELVEQELGIQRILDEQDKLRETIASGINKSWSFETLAIQAGLAKDDDPKASQLWLAAAVAATFTDVVETTDIPVDVSFGAVEYSEESLYTIAEKILVAVIEYLKKLFENSLVLLGKINEFCFGLEARLVRLQNRANRLGHLLVGNEEIPLGANAQNLAVFNGIPIDATSLESHLDNLIAHLKALKQYVDALPRLGKDLAHAIQQFDWDNPDQSLENVRINALRVFDTQLAGMCKLPVPKDIRFSLGKSDRLLVSTPLLGNKSIFYLAADSDGNELAKASAARRSKLQLLNTTQSTKVFEKEQTFKPFTATQTKEVLAKVGLVLAQVKSLGDQGIKNDFKQAKDTLTSAANGLKKPEAAKDAVYESTMEFVKAFSTWGTRPHESLASHSVTVARAVLGLCSSNLDRLR